MTQSLSGKAVTGARIFDGHAWHEGKALLVGQDGHIEAIVAEADIPPALDRVALSGGLLVPGFVDLQVNGGGGVLLNEQPTREGIAAICRAHAKFGTTALLPTLITDRPELTVRAIAAGTEATRAGVPGFLGLHIEGPHISLARKGVHEPSHIRPMQAEDFDRLVAAVSAMPVVMTTLAPEVVPPETITRLSAAGVVVSLGHSDAGCDTARQGAEAGARLVTHLFNAMSGLGHREPGMVGNALDCGALHVGLIADGFHVDPVAIGIALRAKRGPGHIFLVTDAMSPTGTDMTSFRLNGREIFRRDGRLTLADGTLAGADIDMLSSVTFMHRRIGLPLSEALRMASLYPARAVGQDRRIGHLQPGAEASMLHLGDDLALRSVWIRGTELEPSGH
ncbi:N-acetylglucosamine-6-phosphate deacetylase [Jiella sp. M17.18]|uniref:N-acetylglucosamine-6-phosphate deacetylase n=1 Tax=Jiella sp. M17.18 TaxID=3234247 RepID=UPI0034DE633A